MRTISGSESPTKSAAKGVMKAFAWLPKFLLHFKLRFGAADAGSWAAKNPKELNAKSRMTRNPITLRRKFLLIKFISNPSFLMT
jgi:hypothetical protein